MKGERSGVEPLLSFLQKIDPLRVLIRPIVSRT